MLLKLNMSLFLICLTILSSKGIADDLTLQIYRSANLHSYEVLQKLFPSPASIPGITCSKDGICYKNNSFCLSCIGTRNPDLNWFFQNVGENLHSCDSQYALSSEETQDLFLYSSIVPIEYYYAYSPIKLLSEEMKKKFSSLCPTTHSTDTPIVIAFTNAKTGQLQNIPAVLCQGKVFATQKPLQSCEVTIQGMRESINLSKETAFSQKNNLSFNTLSNGITYDIIPFADTMEAEYIACNENQSSLCLAVCGSTKSCLIPINNENTRKGLLRILREKFTTCTPKQLSLNKFAYSLRQIEHFAFTSSSLNLPFDLQTDQGVNSNFDDINTILASFNGIFDKAPTEGTDEFVISEKYRQTIAAKMQTFCNPSESPYFTGTGKSIEKVLCLSNNLTNITVKDIVASPEQCSLRN